MSYLLRKKRRFSVGFNRASGVPKPSAVRHETQKIIKNNALIEARPFIRLVEHIHQHQQVPFLVSFHAATRQPSTSSTPLLGQPHIGWYD